MVPRATPASLPSADVLRPAPQTLSPHVVSRSALASLPSDDEPEFIETSSLDVAGFEEAPIQLGALERSGLLALAALDDDARSGRAAPSPSADPFAPPGGDLDDVVVDLADDEPDRRTTQRPVVNDEVTVRRAVPTPSAEPATRRSAPALEDGPAASLHAPGSLSPTQLGSSHAASSPMSMPGSHAAMPAPVQPGSLYSSSSSPLQLVSSNASAAATGSSGAPTSPVLPPTPRRAPPVAPRTRLATHMQLAASPRARLAAGVALAIVLGFIPAHIVASLREDSAFRPIDSRVTAAHAAVDSLAAYEALDAIRAEQLDAKRSARDTIAMASMLIWAVAGGAIAYVWFRRRPEPS
jgi:hypothetical protein